MDTQPRLPARTITAVKAREKFGQLLDEVYYKGDVVIIERDGRPMAAVIPLSHLAELQHHSSPAKRVPDTVKENKRLSNKRRARG
jgi:prevent-host-death family protein